MKETLLIEFTVENGKNTTISIPDPRSDVSKGWKWRQRKSWPRRPSFLPVTR